MLFALAFFFNFLIGGLSGIFLSDVPSDVTTHGSYFVMAHFHYTIMGGLVFAFFAATYYWLPKMTGVTLNETLGKIHFWLMFVFFNLTFFPLFAAGFLGHAAPGLDLRAAPADPERLRLGLRVRARVLDARLHRQPRLVARVRARAAPRRTRGSAARSSGSCRRRVPVHNFDRIPVITAGPYEYGVPNAPPVADLGAGRSRRRGNRR